MRVIPCNNESAADGDVPKDVPKDVLKDLPKDLPKHGGFLYRLAAAIDSLAAYPVKHALSEREMRHVDAEVARCRQLMSVRPQRPAVDVSRRMPRYALAAVKVRP